MSDPFKPNKIQPYPSQRPEAIEYRGYRLAPQPLSGGGWKVFIYPPNGVVALEKFPHTEAADGRAGVIEEAKRVVDRHRTGRW